MISFARSLLVGVVLLVLGTVVVPGAHAQDAMHAEHAGERSHSIFDEGDLVAVIGNAFTVRAQRFPYIETLLSARLPQHELRFRYLGRSGDEVALRPRPLNFGTLHTHLRDVEPDVIVACFGMNEAYKGLDHLGSFRRNLSTFADSLRTTAYNGDAPPEVVLISPIAHEDLKGVAADVEAHNESLAAYSEAMANYAAQHDNVWAVDLYHPTKEIMESPDAPTLTTNGIHLSEYGYWVVSPIVGEALNLGGGPLRIVLDAGPEEAVGDATPVYNVVPEGPGTAFRVSQVARPLPPPPNGQTSPQSLAPVVEIRNLPRGSHVLEVEGEAVAEADSAAWARGVRVDLQQTALRSVYEQVAQKNQAWFYRYRAVNGEYIYGRRKTPFGVNNFPGEFRRLEMTVESTEHRVWSDLKDLLYLRWRIRAGSSPSAASLQ
ncbi:MAG: SGNH/GDSL hydrolase family protein [Salinivenus sp.]